MAATANLPHDTVGNLAFRGYCGKDQMQDIAGKFVVCFGARQRTGLPQRRGTLHQRAPHGSGVGIINVDDPYFTIEPPRWAAAYARSVTLAEVTGETLAEARRKQPFLLADDAHRVREAFTHVYLMLIKPLQQLTVAMMPRLF